MDFVVEGDRPTVRPNWTLKEVVERNVKSLKVMKANALVCGNGDDWSPLWIIDVLLEIIITIIIIIIIIIIKIA